MAFFPFPGFPNFNGGPRKEVVCQALACALKMQEQMGNYATITSSAGVFRLEMKAGLASGPLFCTTVGDVATRLEYIVAGDVLDRCAEAEHHAPSGQVLIYQEDLQPFMAQVQSVTVAADSRFSRVLAVNYPVRSVPLPLLIAPADWPLSLKPLLAAFLHPAITQRLEAGQASFISEHRRVTSLFGAFEGFDYDHDPFVGTKLQTYLVQVMAIVQRYDGYMRQIDMGDKGSKYIVLFGAPVAHENDEERALRCALELQQLADTQGIVIHTGINTGEVFCGMVGSEVRQEYSMLGDAVNLAARLMQQAGPGQLLVGESTQRAITAHHFQWHALAPLRLKGRSGLTKAFELVGVREPQAIKLQEPTYSLPMVGRAAELATTIQKLELVLQQQGQIVGIVGEAGIGKSRLVAEIIHVARERWIIGYGGECQSHGTNSSYLVWQNVWQAFFGIDPTLPIASQIETLTQQLNLINPALVARLPLLAPVLNLPLPDNDLTRALDAKTRKASLEAMLVDCLRARTASAPMLLVLEDCHWLDPLSADLLDVIGQAIADLPVLLVLAFRPSEGGPERDRLATLEQLSFFTSLHLEEFSAVEATSLIKLKLAQLFGSALSVDAAYTSLIERLQARAQGNPFYIEEFINLMRDQQLDLNDKAALERLDLPGSLQSLVISRIDHLSESAKVTLKVASVIGRLFQAAWLWGFYPQLGGQQQVKRELDILSRLDITPLDTPEPELEYLFKHIVTRDVAYESLALTTRAILHEQLAVFIERTYADRLEQYLDLLAYHYGRSHHSEKKREYFRKAGDAAQAIYANQTATEYYQKLLPLLPDQERPALMLQLGQVWQMMGNWDAADQIYREALALAQDTSQKACCQSDIGALLWRRGEYAEAYHWLEQAWGIFVSVGDEAGISFCVTEMGIAASSQGNYLKAQSLLLEGLSLSRQRNDKRAIVTSLYHLGDAVSSQGYHAMAHSYYQEGLSLSRELGDKPAIVRNLNGLGLLACNQGEQVKARALLVECLEVARQIGNKRGTGVALNTLGDVVYMQGDFAMAHELYSESLSIGREMGDRPGVVYAMLNLGRAKFSLGEWMAAEQLYTETLALGCELGNRHIIAYCLAGLANVASANAEWARGVRLAGATSKLLETIGAVFDTAEQTDFNRTLKSLRQQQSEVSFETGWQEGTMMSLEQATRYARAPECISRQTV